MLTTHAAAAAEALSVAVDDMSQSTLDERLLSELAVAAMSIALLVRLALWSTLTLRLLAEWSLLPEYDEDDDEEEDESLWFELELGETAKLRDDVVLLLLLLASLSFFGGTCVEIC